MTHTPRELWRRFVFLQFKWKWLAFWTLTLSLGVGLFGVWLMDPAWKATAKILVRNTSQQRLVTFKDLQTQGPVQTQINPAFNLVELSTSRGVAEEVAKHFNLDREEERVSLRDDIKYWAIEAAISPITLLEKMGILDEKPENYLADAIEDLIDDVQDIEVMNDTEIIDLTIWGPTPELAPAIANYMAEILVQRTRDMTRRQADEAYQFSKEQVVIAEKSLQEAEERLTKFKLDNQIIAIEEQRPLVLKRLDQLSSERANALVALKEAEARTEEVRKQLGEQEPTLISSRIEAYNPIHRELETTQSTIVHQLTSLQVARSMLSPEVSKLQAQLVELQHQLADKPKMVEESKTTVPNPIRQQLLTEVVNLTSEVSALKAKAETWSAEVAAVEKQVSEMSRNEPILERLQREKDTHEDRFKTLETRLLELEVQRMTQASDYDIRVIDPARVVENADYDYPDWEMVLLIAIPAALIIALAMPLVAEYFTDTMDTAAQAEAALQLPVLGAVPYLNTRSGKG